MKRTAILLNLLLLLATVFPVYAQVSDLPAPVAIKSEAALPLKLSGADVKYLEDTGHPLSFADVSGPDLLKLFKAIAHAPKGVADKANVWFVYRLINVSDQTVTVAPFVFSQHTNVYASLGGGHFKHYISGANVPRSKRDGFKDLYAIPYSIPPGDTLTVFEHDEGTASAGIGRSWNINQAERLMEKQNERLIGQQSAEDVTATTLTGFFLFAAIFNLFFFYTTRERVYFIFGLTILVGTVIFWPHTAILLRELPHKYYELITYIISDIMFLGFTWVVILLLMMPQYHPVWGRIIFGISLFRIVIMTTYQEVIDFAIKTPLNKHLNLMLGLAKISGVLFFGSVAIVIIIDLIKKGGLPKFL